MTPEETIEKVSCDLFPGCINEDEYKTTGEARKLEASKKRAVNLNDPKASFITVASIKQSLNIWKI